jgi:hypothetical protein
VRTGLISAFARRNSLRLFSASWIIAGDLLFDFRVVDADTFFDFWVVTAGTLFDKFVDLAHADVFLLLDLNLLDLNVRFLDVVDLVFLAEFSTTELDIYIYYRKIPYYNCNNGFGLLL